jgi:hypothetical protein
MSAYLSFESRKRDGIRGEEAIYRHFSPDWIVTCVSRDLQKFGIDFRFVHKTKSIAYWIEVKTDYRAGKTGNAFIETVSCDARGTRGWALTSRADYLFYFLPDDLLIYALQPPRLPALVREWTRRYRSVSVPNFDYNTRGILVPLHELETHAKQVITL